MAYKSHRSPQHPRADRVPSAAWLAAQAAFSAPSSSPSSSSATPPLPALPALPAATPAEPAVVSVRKPWAPALAPPAQALPPRVQPAETANAPTGPERPARVFLVVTAPSPGSDGSHDSALPNDPGTHAATARPAPRPTLAALPRQRLHADKQPGPVRHITLAASPAASPGQPHGRPLPPAAAATPAGNASVAEQAQALRVHMRQLNAVFDDIQRARSLHFLA